MTLMILGRKFSCYTKCHYAEGHYAECFGGSGPGSLPNIRLSWKCLTVTNELAYLAHIAFFNEPKRNTLKEKRFSFFSPIVFLF
jgi:hypothetical protein